MLKTFSVGIYRGFASQSIFLCLSQGLVPTC